MYCIVLVLFFENFQVNIVDDDYFDIWICFIDNVVFGEFKIRWCEDVWLSVLDIYIFCLWKVFNCFGDDCINLIFNCLGLWIVFDMKIVLVVFCIKWCKNDFCVFICCNLGEFRKFNVIIDLNCDFFVVCIKYVNLVFGVDFLLFVFIWCNMEFILFFDCFVLFE